MKTSPFTPFIKLIGEESFNDFKNKHITIIGLGGIGQPLILNLVHSGFTNFTLYDHDIVQESNLHRQFLTKTSSVGQYKIDVIKEYFEDLQIKIELKKEKWTHQEIKTDLVIDASDDPLTRQSINRYTQANNIPFLFLSANRWDAQMALFYPKSGCLECIFNDLYSIPCTEQGVSIATTQAISAFAAKLVFDFFTDKPNIHNVLYHLSLDSFNLTSFKVAKNSKCHCQKNLFFFNDLYIDKNQCDEIINLESQDESQISLDKKTGLFCQNGIKARRTLIKLRNLGYEKVYLIRE